MSPEEKAAQRLSFAFGNLAIDRSEVEKKDVRIAAWQLRVAELEAERDRLRAEIGEWVRAANLAFRGNPQTEREIADNRRRGIDALIALANGNGFVHSPPGTLELVATDRDRLAVRVAELEDILRRTDRD